MFWDYYYRTGDTVNPIVSYILLGILVLSLAGIALYNHRQDKKKRSKF